MTMSNGFMTGQPLPRDKVSGAISEAFVNTLLDRFGSSVADGLQTKYRLATASWILELHRDNVGMWVTADMDGKRVLDTRPGMEVEL